MRKLEGLSASSGIVIGSVFCFAENTDISIPKYSITNDDVENHWARFEIALEISKKEILMLKDEQNREQSGMLDAQFLMLSDPEFIPSIKKSLQSRLENIETVLKDMVAKAADVLRAAGDSYLSERAIDIEDAFDRALGHLLSESQTGGSYSATNRFVPPGTILVARSLKPSEAMSLKDSRIAGLVLEEGGATSHVAILARSWRIPAVMGVRDALSYVSDGKQIILDAVDGLVILDAPTDVIASYKNRLLGEDVLESDSLRQRLELRSLESKTSDGVKMTLRANIALSEEAKISKEEGAEGVGLFRSEFLFLATENVPDEEFQYEAYREAVLAMEGFPVVIRTLDVGADKMLGEQVALYEKNPLLGWRAVRYCLDRRDFFKTQIRALLRASVHGDLRIMFPMISNVDELDAVLDVLDEAKQECTKKKQPFNKRLKVGIMIEIPAAAVCADLLAKKVDFLSIGTNDLIQYTMAVDRENQKVAHLYDGYNPAVLRLIRTTIEAGRDANIEVSMCGEMAGDPSAVVLLMGMGLRSFSMSAALIAPVKELIRAVSLSDAVELSNSACKLSAAREIRKLVQERIKSYEK